MRNRFWRLRHCGCILNRSRRCWNHTRMQEKNWAGATSQLETSLPLTDRGLSGPPGPKCRKSLENVSRGPKKSPKRPGTLQKHSPDTFWRVLRRLAGLSPRLFLRLFGVPGASSPTRHFRVTGGLVPNLTKKATVSNTKIAQVHSLKSLRTTHKGLHRFKEGYPAPNPHNRKKVFSQYAPWKEGFMAWAFFRTMGPRQKIWHTNRK